MKVWVNVRNTNPNPVATLFTEHDVDVVFRFAARVIVLDRGRIIADGPPATVRADPRVQAVYLGTEVA